MPVGAAVGGTTNSLLIFVLRRPIYRWTYKFHNWTEADCLASNLRGDVNAS